MGPKAQPHSEAVLNSTHHRCVELSWAFGPIGRRWFIGSHVRLELVVSSAYKPSSAH
jgi:hypothetical protein